MGRTHNQTRPVTVRTKASKTWRPRFTCACPGPFLHGALLFLRGAPLFSAPSLPRARTVAAPRSRRDPARKHAKKRFVSRKVRVRQMELTALGRWARAARCRHRWTRLGFLFPALSTVHTVHSELPPFNDLDACKICLHWRFSSLSQPAVPTLPVLLTSCPVRAA